MICRLSKVWWGEDFSVPHLVIPHLLDIVSCSTFGITACKFLPSCAGFHLLPLCEWCPWVLCFVCVACLLPRSSWCRGGCVAFKMYHCRSFYHHILTSVYRLHVNKWHGQSTPYPKPAFKIEGTVRCKDCDFWPWWWGNTFFLRHKLI